MKKYLFSSLLLALVAVFSLSLVSCSDDDDDDNGSDGGGSAKAGQYTLTINGDVWHSRADHEPTYEGSFYRVNPDGSTFIYCRFTRNDYIVELGSSDLMINITTSLGCDLNKGIDIATSNEIYWGSGTTEWGLDDGPWGSTNEYNVVTYGGKYGCSGGSAIIEDLSEGEFITINFTNFQLPLLEVSYEGKGNVADPMILDGTVTFTYVEKYADL